MDRRITIRGKRYRLIHDKLPKGVDGYCDHRDTPNKAIRIRPSLKGERKMEILIHEMLHAASWDLDEEAVTEIASDLARVLWSLGYKEA